MLWILITAPLMLVAIAIAVVPVLYLSIREARLETVALTEAPEEAVVGPEGLEPAGGGEASDRLVA